jgi:mono/diheme cytochrome c family protein
VAGRRAAILFVVLAALPAGIGSRVETASTQTASFAAASSPPVRAVLDQYCVQCHNARARTAGIELDALDATRPAAEAEVWERVIRKLRAGTMPPAGMARPDAATYHAVAGWLETEIDRAAATNPNPGRSSTVHRLNRTEYANAVRDLLAVQVDLSALPADDTSDTGFDNNADVLSIAPTQLERYLSVARRVTRLAVGLPPSGPVVDTFDVPNLLVQDDRQSEELPLGSRGGLAVRYQFPVDGEYLIKVRLLGNYQTTRITCSAWGRRSSSTSGSTACCRSG